MGRPLQILSLGAGVQSSTMALMAARGELPLPDAAIFADTQDEPSSVYRWLDWLEKQLPFPVFRVTAGRLSEAEVVVRTSKKSGFRYRRSLIPAFGRKPTGERAGIFPRKCTRDFKLDVIFRKARELAEVPRNNRQGVYAVQWIGISKDEAHRAKPSQQPWAETTHPLLLHGVTRQDCKTWMAEQGYPEPPRSACMFCPYHSDAEWVRLQNEEPQAFEFAVDFEQRVQASAALDEVAHAIPYLHEDRIPLRDVTFDNISEGDEDDPEEGVGRECEGMCGR